MTAPRGRWFPNAHRALIQLATLSAGETNREFTAIFVNQFQETRICRRQSRYPGSRARRFQGAPYRCAGRPREKSSRARMPEKAAQRFKIAVPEARNRSGVHQAAAGADDCSGKEKRARKALDRIGCDLAFEIVSKKRCGQ